LPAVHGTERARVRACSGSAGQQDQGLASAIGHVGTPAGYDLDQALIRENPDSLAGGEPRHPVLLHQACLRGDRPSRLWVPKTSSTSCDQSIFVDQTTDARLPSYAVLVEIDRLG
jgi:hypothetical protein